MKTRFTFIGLVATFILCICTFFISCNKDIYDTVTYRGQVVYINTSNPFPNLLVKVTDGTNTHCQTQTDDAGYFSLKVRINEINGSYYLLAGDATCVPTRKPLGSYGQAEVDLGVIEVEGPSKPVVVTNKKYTVTADGATLGGEVISDGRLTVTARGICYDTVPYPDMEKGALFTTDGTGVGAFVSELKNLRHKTIYYARAYATNSMGTAYDTAQVKFTTEEGVPVVTTDTIIRITAHTAQCKGRVESDGGYAVTRRGTCWGKHSEPTIDDGCSVDGSGIGEFTSELRDLVENTTYYVRTYAINSTGTVYGEQKVITTLDGMPAVTTDSTSNISATSFIAHGTVLSDCDIPVAERGFCYSTKQYPTINDKRVAVNKGLGDFHSRINELEAATTYYVRAYATNATGTAYGEQITVLTLDGLAVVQTDSVTNITSKSVTAHGSVILDCDVPVTERGFCYSTSQYPEIDDKHVAIGKGLGKFNGNISNLERATTYYVRAYAINNYGTTYGEQIKITTLDGMAVVTTDSVANVTATSFMAYGNVKFDCYLPITARGFCYAKTQSPTIEDNCVSVGKTTGAYEATISNLEIKTTYYVRAYVTNANGTSYGEQIAVQTTDGMPVVSTSTPTTSYTNIEAGGNVTSDGGFPVTARGICYSTINPEPTLADSHVEQGRGIGVFSVTITDVELETIYYVRAFATNSTGTSYGEAIAIETEYEGYYIKHSWGSGMDEDWTWQRMSEEGSNYVYEGLWGGIGANINTRPSDGNADWFPESQIDGASSLVVGDGVKFIYNPTALTLSVVKTSSAPTTKAQVRFCKEKAYDYAKEMVIWQVSDDGTGEFVTAASHEFGTSDGTSPYYEIDAKISYPAYYYDDGTEENKGYYFALSDDNSYTFKAGRKYTFTCSDDGEYLTFSIIADGTMDAPARVVAVKRIAKSQIATMPRVRK